MMRYTDSKIKKDYLQLSVNDIEENADTLDQLFKDRKSFIIVALLKDKLYDYDVSIDFHHDFFKREESIKGFVIGMSYFGIKDILGPLPESIQQLKDSDDYKKFKNERSL